MGTVREGDGFIGSMSIDVRNGIDNPPDDIGYDRRDGDEQEPEIFHFETLAHAALFASRSVTASGMNRDAVRLDGASAAHS